MILVVSPWMCESCKPYHATPTSFYNTDGSPYALCMRLSLIYQLGVCACVWVTLSEWTITKNLLNSCCSLSLPPSVSTPSPHFTSRCSDKGFGCPSPGSLLIPSCHFVRLNTGVSRHSLSPHASLISHSFQHQTTEAYPPRRLMYYTFTSCLISASPPRLAVQINCVSNKCVIAKHNRRTGCTISPIVCFTYALLCCFLFSLCFIEMDIWQSI